MLQQITVLLRTLQTGNTSVRGILVYKTYVCPWVSGICECAITSGKTERNNTEWKSPSLSLFHRGTSDVYAIPKVRKSVIFKVREGKLRSVLKQGLVVNASPCGQGLSSRVKLSFFWPEWTSAVTIYLLKSHYEAGLTLSWAQTERSNCDRDVSLILRSFRLWLDFIVCYEWWQSTFTQELKPSDQAQWRIWVIKSTLNATLAFQRQML